MEINSILQIFGNIYQCKGKISNLPYLLIFTFAMENRQTIKNRYQYDKVQIED